MINVLIPACGNGSRFANIGISTPKPLIKVNDKALIQHAIDSLGIKSGSYIVITKNFGNSEQNFELTNIIKGSKRAAHELLTNEKKHFGASFTCSLSKKLFEDNSWMESPLIITNCDQLLLWDADKFVNFIKDNDPDGAIVLYDSVDPKNSFAEIVDEKVVRVVEKDPISSAALIGVHYWKKAKYFFESAQKLDESLIASDKERYVSETYNFLIDQGLTILPYFIEKSEFVPLGTPEDVNKYLTSLSQS